MNIFVGNLDFQTTDNELQNLFSEFGPVKSVNIVMDKYTNRPRGFAFVEMENAADGQKAIDKLNNTNVNSRTISVNEARPRTENRERSGGREGGYGGNKRFNNRY
jgi:cold-inducible RNA-binding protein